mmetsp:Transcript_110183/g.310738  ORF Transcript_110183/g.310738 Transcript_110183/m.310738 type:complete len:225 (-) Transcript_110183:2-676(-)
MSKTSTTRVFALSKSSCTPQALITTSITASTSAKASGPASIGAAALAAKRSKRPNAAKSCASGKFMASKACTSQSKASSLRPESKLRDKSAAASCNGAERSWRARSDGSRGGVPSAARTCPRPSCSLASSLVTFAPTPATDTVDDVLVDMDADALRCRSLAFGLSRRHCPKPSAEVIGAPAACIAATWNPPKEQLLCANCPRRASRHHAEIRCGTDQPTRGMHT